MIAGKAGLKERMPSERAKENKTLAANCAACGKLLSTELLSAVVVGQGRHRRLLPLCEPCREKGWTPPAEEASPAS